MEVNRRKQNRGWEEEEEEGRKGVEREEKRSRDVERGDGVR